MQLNLNIFKVVPSKTSSLIEKVGIVDSIIKDVANFSVDENNIIVNFNDGTSETIPLRSNDGDLNEDWRGFNLFATRQFLEVDMSK